MKTHSKNKGPKCTMMMFNNPEETSDFPDAPGHHWYECKICGKKYDTFQALGGHQGRHRKVRSIDDGDVCSLSLQTGAPASHRLHQCKMCTKKFHTGQALGGHMRRHKLEKDLADRELPRRQLTTEEELESELVLEDVELRQQMAGEEKEHPARSELVLAAKEFRLAL
ncbi:hypothetical protein L2E82_42325 [Cichorium intybus]|uniref:Uncharacterized protein n=1 Tax=Cichorium intybus TaxID=13427 RepID=A0ACB8ZLT5_CICIN|nr:hypothetical protein L2E82_42325 [Cichorium intybus]